MKQELIYIVSFLNEGKKLKVKTLNQEKTSLISVPNNDFWDVTVYGTRYGYLENDNSIPSECQLTVCSKESFDNIFNKFKSMHYVHKSETEYPTIVCEYVPGMDISIANKKTIELAVECQKSNVFIQTLHQTGITPEILAKKLYPHDTKKQKEYMSMSTDYAESSKEISEAKKAKHAGDHPELFQQNGEMIDRPQVGNGLDFSGTKNFITYGYKDASALLRLLK